MHKYIYDLEICNISHANHYVYTQVCPVQIVEPPEVNCNL